MHVVYAREEEDFADQNVAAFMRNAKIKETILLSK